MEQIVESLVFEGVRSARAGARQRSQPGAEQELHLKILMRHETLWAAAGHTHVVFGLSPGELPEITSGKVVRITRPGR